MLDDVVFGRNYFESAWTDYSSIATIILAVINQLIEVLCWELREYCREFSLGNSLVGKSSVIFYK